LSNDAKLNAVTGLSSPYYWPDVINLSAPLHCTDFLSTIYVPKNDSN